MKKKQFYSHDEILDITLGKDTPEREDYELNIELLLVGCKIREIREAKKMTQEDLGNLVGVQKAQISKIENGSNPTISTVMKIFNALDVEVKFQIGRPNGSLSII